MIDANQSDYFNLYSPRLHRFRQNNSNRVHLDLHWHLDQLIAVAQKFMECVIPSFDQCLNLISDLNFELSHPLDLDFSHIAQGNQTQIYQGQKACLEPAPDLALSIFLYQDFPS